MGLCLKHIILVLKFLIFSEGKCTLSTFSLCGQIWPQTQRVISWCWLEEYSLNVFFREFTFLWKYVENVLKSLFMLDMKVNIFVCLTEWFLCYWSHAEIFFLDDCFCYAKRTVLKKSLIKKKSGVSRSITLFFEVRECCQLEKEWKKLIQHRLNIELGVKSEWGTENHFVSFSCAPFT